MKREITCIICPRGCNLEVEITESGAVVTGNACPKGEQYGIDECTNPVRTVTSVIRISNREDTMVSVKTGEPIKKEHISEAMKVIREATAQAPVKIGDVLIKDVFGADIVATKPID